MRAYIKAVGWGCKERGREGQKCERFLRWEILQHGVTNLTRNKEKRKVEDTLQGFHLSHLVGTLQN